VRAEDEPKSELVRPAQESEAQEGTEVKALSGWQPWLCHGGVPGMTTCPNPYRGFRFSAEVIEHAV